MPSDAVRLLLDQNLSPSLVVPLSVLFPGTRHVRELGLERAPDLEVWRRAAAAGFVITSKDADFHQLSFTLGPPPKVIWIRIGNCTTNLVEETLKRHAEAIRGFHGDSVAALLALDGPRA